MVDIVDLYHLRRMLFFSTIESFGVIFPRMLKWQKSKTSHITIFFFIWKLNDHVSSLHQGHANFPLVLHPNRFSICGKIINSPNN